ncbi:hypothetical protein JCM10908_002322 [Rhodotorula pacifica]|uniref:uncharacterized protein n=1 Tax=Rhodotorula pacifica TaxID=1495444 RepID=UPI003174601E
MIDSLVQFLLEEIAMDGDAGTSIEALAEFIEQFYSRNAAAGGVGNSEPVASTSTSTAATPVPGSITARAQKIDDAFITFVWNAIVELPDVRVGVLSKLDKPGTAAATTAKDNANGIKQDAGGGGDKDGDAPMQQQEGDDVPEPSDVAKGKRKKIERKVEGPTHEMRILPAEERELGRDALVEKYGDKLRVLSGEETTWVAITGSHLRPSSLTPTIYSVLQMISRCREEGATAVRISKELGIDPKSVFHYLKVPQQLGIIKKFRDTDDGRWTNRALHVRYLATSPIWAVHVNTEPDAIKDEEGGEDGAGAEEDGGAEGQWGGDEMSPISPLYLTTNHEVIRKRIVKALKRRKDWWMPHFDLHTAIGLHAATSLSLRRLNSIVTSMAEEGILEKVNVTKRKSGGNQTRIQAIRLRGPDELKVGEDAADIEVKTRRHAIQEAQEEDEEDDGSSYPATMRTIEQQVLDLLMNAGSRGITNNEISSALGNFSMRFIEAILQRLGRYTLPPHLADYTIYSLSETVGRLKHTRWFSLVGYLSYRRARGFPDEAQEERWKAIEEQGRLGKFDEEPGEGPREGQYGTAVERQKRLNKFNMWAHAGDRNADVGVRKKKAVAAGARKEKTEAGETGKAKGKEKGKGKGKGKGKAAATEVADVEADNDHVDDDDDDASGPELPKPKGRPRKNPLKPGEESPYMRRKREKAEDEERARLGLPPLVRPAKPRGRTKKQTTEGDGDEAASSPAVVAGESAAPGTSAETPTTKKEKGKAPTADGSPVSTPAPKKRGRPPKVKQADVAPETPAAGTSAPASAPAAAPAAPATDARPSMVENATAPTSSKRAVPAAATPSLRKRVLTMEPFIEIDVPSPSKRSKTSSAAPATASSAAAPTLAPPSVATPSPAVAGPSGTQGGRIEPAVQTPRTTSVAPLAEVTLDALTTPAEDTPQSSPAPGGKMEAGSSPAEAKAKKKARSSRPSVASKLNLTQLTRQKEVLDYVAASGGMIERTHRLNELVHAWSSSQTPPVSLYMMDKHIVNEVLNVAVRGGRLKKTVTTGSKGERYEVYYLPTIDLASDEARQYLLNLSEPDRPNRFQMYRAVAEITHDSEEEAEPKDAIGTGKKRLHEEQTLDDPEPGQDKAVVQEYFRQQQAVLGRVHGVKYGLVARARQLHKWLASYVFRRADDPNSGIARDNGDLVIAQHGMLDSMPLGVFRRIVPLPIESELLDAYLANEANQHTPMRDLPAEIAALVRPRLGKRKAAMWRNLELLMDLRLLSPAVLRVNERGAEGFAKPRVAKQASHWRFHVQAPLYSFADANAPLVAVHTLDSNQKVTAYWTALQSVSTAQHREPLPGTVAEGFPSSYSGRALSRRELVSVARWRDTYQLVPTQRTFLCKLGAADPDILDESRTANLAEWARCLYAPVEVVSRYLSDVINGRLVRDSRGKRRRIRKVVVGADGVETEVMVTDDEGPRESANEILARKRREAAAQQEQDWNGILERFRRDHAEPQLEPTILEWLHAKFIDPRPSNKLDAKQLDFELRRLLPAVAVGHPGPAEDRQTLVPLAVQRKVRRIKDPYAVTYEPNIRKRTAAKAKKPRPAAGQQKPSAPRQREVSPFVPLPSDDPNAPFEPADQRAFLKNPLPPYPKNGPGKRISRSHFATEHDELLLDAEAVLQVRAQANNVRVQFGALEWFFPGNTGGVLSKRVRTLLKRAADKDLHDRVINAFAEVYEAHKAAVRDPNPHSLVNFDLAAWIRLLREKVNKRQLRLMAAPAVQLAQKAADLPGSLLELGKYYHLKSDDGSTSLESRWDKVWGKHHVASAIRDEAVASVPYAQTWDDKAPYLPQSRKEALALGALKSVLSTSDETYREEEGEAMLKPFVAEIDAIVDELTEKGHIVKAERDDSRRIPGRNFSFTDKYLNRFGTRIELSHMQEASLCEQDVLASTEAIFPLAPVPGEMMAFFDLVSEGKVTLSIDTSTLTDKALDVQDYGTRQANDDDIECTINIVPVSASQSRSTPSASILPDPLLNLSELGTNAEVETAVSALSTEADSLASNLLEAITKSGKEGIPYERLLKRYEERSSAASREFVDAVARLTATSPPLAFFAGETAISLVSVRYVAEWSLPVPKLDAANDAASDKRFLPAIWTTVRGEVNAEMFQRAAGWLKGELKARSGAIAVSRAFLSVHRDILGLIATSSLVGQIHLVDRAAGSHRLSAYEVRMLLLTLLKAGKIACRQDPVDGEVDATGKTAACTDVNQINWARAHWFSEGVFW